MKAKTERWKPFHFWTRGKLKADPVLMLTESEASDIEWLLNMLASHPSVILLKNTKKLLADCNRVLNRRNMKMLADDEYGEIRNRDVRFRSPFRWVIPSGN